MSKRRRSPRLSSTPPKRAKLERTSTIELEDGEENVLGIHRKTSSFLQQTDESGSFSSLSDGKKAKLIRRLSNILDPSKEEGTKNYQPESGQALTVGLSLSLS